MSLVKLYDMQAGPGQADTLRAALEKLAAAVVQVPGNLGADLYSDAKTEGRFVFLETWESAEAHKDSGNHLDQGLFGAVMKAVDSKPGSATLIPVKSL